MNKDIKLTSGRILLRPYSLDDAKYVYEAARESVNDVHIWMPWCHADYSMEESKKWMETTGEAWDKGTAYEFAILDSRSGCYLGGCGLNQINPVYKMANLGYWVRSSRTRQGVATVAAKLLVKLGFDELKLNRIEIVVATGNKASQRVAEKVGAKREGILRNRLMNGDKVHDAVIFSLIPQDLE
jgi:ribosomal-protein-serine acetyltransferase